MFDRLEKKSAVLVSLIAASALAACSPRSEDTHKSAETDAPAAPAVAEGSDLAYTFAIGEFTAVALRDGALEFPNDTKIFGVGHAAEDVAAVLANANLRTDKLGLSLQPLLVRTADRVLLFDTGAGSNFGPSAGKLLASVAAAGIEQQSVTDIFISHAHGDHVGGLVDAQGALVFPAATIHMSAPEWDFLKGMDAEGAKNFGIAQHAALIAAIESKVAAFTPGADILPGVVKAVEIRGHTPGHSGYMITSGESSLLYIGDTMHHFVVSVQKPDWTIAFDGDAPTAEASRSDVLSRSAASGQRIYAVHFPFPGIGRFERSGDGFVWAAESAGEP